MAYQDADLCGLSPRTRGRHGHIPPRAVLAGSIPANAGETR